MPLVVYKVFPDGRPDQLVRGVDIVGTPLVSLTKIVATGDKPEIFNGYCGAESGSVPVSAVAPAILISEMEFAEERNFHGPAADPAAAGARSRCEGASASEKIATLHCSRRVCAAAFAAHAARQQIAPGRPQPLPSRHSRRR